MSFPRRPGWESWTFQTVGEVLDAPILSDCRSRTYYFTEKRGGAYGIRFSFCERRSCPQCVVAWIVNRLAPPFAVWQGSASFAKIAGGPRSDRQYRALGVRMSGTNATPGVLSVERGGNRIIIAPESAGIGDVLEGDYLKEFTRDLFRAIPIDPWTPPDERQNPLPTRGTVPKNLRQDTLEAMAASVGLPAFRSNGRNRVSDGATLDQATALFALIRDHKR